MKTNNALQRGFSLRFRKLLSGAADGVPPWLDVVAAGDDAGLFLPADAPWIVHRDFGTLVGGIRALLMQALHPGALAGVSQHSRYSSDPLGRLSGTIRWLTVTTFGSSQAVAGEANRVNRLHTRVSGEFVDGRGQERAYHASNPDLLLWVHVAFMESFLVAHERYADAPIPCAHEPSGGDNYVKQWGCSVAPLGLSDVPKTRAEMDAVLDGFRDRGDLTVTDDTRRVIAFIRKPPLPALAKPIYALLFQAAVISLRPDFRAMHGIRTAPDWFVRVQTKVLLRALRVAVGPESPIEEAALNRLRRLGAI